MHTNTNHTYKRYDKELNKLRDQISRMGNHVSRQLNLLLNHLETCLLYTSDAADDRT